MQLTQAQINADLLTLRSKHIRIALLNFDMKTVDTIETECVGGSLTENANDDIRKSGSIEVAIPINLSGQTFLETLDGYSIELGGKIWLDKYVKIFIGIEDYTQNPMQIVWQNKGVYLIDQPVRNFSGTEFTISFNIIDLMAKYTGLRQGQLTSQGLYFSDGEYSTDTPPVFQRVLIADLLASVITELAGITNYSIYPIPAAKQYLPYALSFGIGTTVYDILKQILDILSTWQMYFDEDGTLVIEPIPSGVNDSVYPLEQEQLIRSSPSVDFQSVKNQVVLYGKLNEATAYTANLTASDTNVAYSGNTLVLKYASLNTANFTILGTRFAFQSLSTYNSVPLTTIQIYNNGSLIINTSLVAYEGYDPTTGDKTYISANSIIPNTSYVIRIVSANLDTSGQVVLDSSLVMEFYSKQQVSWCEVCDNTESPFYINSPITGENYYCGTAFTGSTFNVGEDYLLTLNDNKTPITALADKTILTFMANATNNAYASGFEATLIEVQSSSGATLVQDIPIVQNSWTYNTTTQTYVREPIALSKIVADYTIYEVQYDQTNSQFVFLGRYPYSITKVLSGGEFDVIFCDQLAYERCVYELYKATSLNNNIKLDIVPNYNLRANVKIPFSQSWELPIGVNTDLTNEITYNYFLIKSVTFPLGIDNTPQNIEAIQIYDDKNLVGNDYQN